MDALPLIESKLNVDDTQAQSNREAWTPVLDKFETYLHATTSEGNEGSLLRHQRKGQLLGRQPIPFS
jgi:hypothetical protein